MENSLGRLYHILLLLYGVSHILTFPRKYLIVFLLVMNYLYLFFTVLSRFVLITIIIFFNYIYILLIII